MDSEKTFIEHLSSLPAEAQDLIVEKFVALWGRIHYHKNERALAITMETNWRGYNFEIQRWETGMDEDTLQMLCSLRILWLAGVFDKVEEVRFSIYRVDQHPKEHPYIWEDVNKLLFPGMEPEIFQYLDSRQENELWIVPGMEGWEESIPYPGPKQRPDRLPSGRPHRQRTIEVEIPWEEESKVLVYGLLE
ncbi:hypothetical protein SELMODRAFT_422465 [Selaginella moellendorffii]|uniref:Uncharacterized protein n=1 Tax=Selaginella moellendorffii TaxID=88036 RepID=D8SIH1_SELML|nr:hypothetical protein SELMODRAFT_422465 [Selaginella moellendorffii]